MLANTVVVVLVVVLQYNLYFENFNMNEQVNEVNEHEQVELD